MANMLSYLSNILLEILTFNCVETGCTERNHQQPLVRFVKLRNAI